MKKMMICFLLLSSCSYFSKRAEPEVLITPDQAAMNHSENLLKMGQFDAARVSYETIQQRFPQSLYFEAARLGQAQSLEGLGRYTEALELNKDIANKNRAYRPEIAAIAFYHMSFCYEALGDDLKTVAALLDAKTLSAKLPPAIANAEIPARLAQVYGRQGRQDEAIAYLNEAEKGLAKVRDQGEKDLDKSWLAKTYVQMGSVSTNQLSAEGYEPFLLGQALVQPYLLKALSLDDPEWSKKAASKLKETYRDLYLQLESFHEQRQLQADLGGKFLNNIDQAELYKPISELTLNAYEKDFYTFLSEVKKKTEKILFERGETMGLTPESQELNSLKRAGRIVEKPVALPPKIVPTEDPNL